jgi:hypothetical protein
MRPAALAAFVTLLAVAGGARAENADAAMVAAVPDASLRAMTGKRVRLELEGQPAVEGQLAGFEAQWVTVVLTGNNEVISVPRERLVHLKALDAGTEPAAPDAAAPERERVIGVHFGLSVSLAVDAQWRLFYGFVNGNVLFPLTTVTGNAAWMALAFGAGFTVPLERGHRWYADLVGQVLPLYLGSPYTYVGMGLGFGLRYLARSGFTFAVKLPVLGYAARVGRSPYGYDSSFRAGYGFGYYYLAGLMGLPLVSVGYRF